MSIRSESRTKFENQGVYLTQLNLQMGNMDGSEQQEAIKWLMEEEKKVVQRETWRYRWMVGLAFVAAVAASIAAWGTMKEWVAR